MNRRRKQQILICCLLMAVMMFLSIKGNGLYFDPEKAFWETEKFHGIGPSKHILLQREIGDEIHFVGVLEHAENTELQKHTGYEVPEYSGYCSMVSLEKALGIFWKESEHNGTYIEYFQRQKIEAWHQFDMGVLLGHCGIPEVTEVYMKWSMQGELLDGPLGYQIIYEELGSDVFSVDADGYFYTDIDEETIKEQYRNNFAVMATYLEGRDAEGNILYRHGTDDAGRRFILNEEKK